MKKLSLLFLMVLTISVQTVYAEPYIRNTGGLGQYGYFEKDAITESPAPFLVANGGYVNIYNYGVRSSINGTTNDYRYMSTTPSGCTRNEESTTNFNPTLTTGSTVYSSVFVEYCGSTYSHISMTPTSTCFNERSFFVMDLTPKTDAMPSIIDKSIDKNVVLTFTLSNANTSGQTLNRLWINNDGTAV